MRLALAGVVALGACGGEGGAPVMRTDSAGVRITVSPDASRQFGRLDPEPVVEIGGVDAMGPSQLYQIMGVHIDLVGRVWVADGQSNELRIFAPDGSHWKTRGGAGEGPEEFVRIRLLGSFRGDSVAFGDNSNGRVTVYDPEGEFVRTTRLPLVNDVTPLPRAVFEDGSVLAQVPRILRADETAPGEILADTVRLLRIALDEGTTRDPVTAPGPLWLWTGRSQVPIPFTINADYAPVDEVVHLTDRGPDFRVRVYASGRLAESYGLARPARTVTGAAIDEHRSYVEEFAPEGLASEAAGLGTPAADEFGRVTSVTTDLDANVWVADAVGRQIKVLRPDGFLLLEMGREGEGPGEFSWINSIAWVGDVLLALDFANGRITEMSSSGEVLGTRPTVGRISGSSSLLRFFPVSERSVFQWALRTVDGQSERTWIEHGPDGVVSEGRQLTPRAPAETVVVCQRADGVSSFFEIPFGGRLLQHPRSAGEAWVTWSRDYRVALLGPTGDTLRLIDRESSPVPVTDEEWASGTAELDEYREEWPGAECEPRGMDRPERRAAIRNVLVNTDGRLWIEAEGEGGPLWEIFDAAGRLVGSVPGFDYDANVVPSLRGDLIAWVSVDDVGAQYVHWARVVRPAD